MAVALEETQFRQWLSSKGGYVSPKVSLFSPIGSDERGVTAKESITAGEQLLLVPQALCITVPAQIEEVQNDALREAIDYLHRCGQHLQHDLSCVALLLSEMAKGQDSTYHPFLCVLPSHTKYMMPDWTPQEKEQLKGISLWSATDLHDVFRHTLLPVLQGAPHLWPPTCITFENFRRALGLVLSRAFRMNKENWVMGTTEEGEALFLIPGIDMLNHSSNPSLRSTTIQFLPGDLTVHTQNKTATFNGCFTLKAERDIPAGHEILHSYGDLSDSQLLQVYGFVEQWATGQANPHNYVWLPTEAVVEVSRTCLQEGEGQSIGNRWPAPERMELLNECGLLPLHYVILKDTPLTDELLSVVQVLCMDEDEFDAYKQLVRKQMKQADKEECRPEKRAGLLGLSTLEGDAVFGHAVCTVLLRLVDRMMKQYNTTMKEDEELLDDRGGQLSEHVRAAVQVRYGEKVILSNMKKEVIKLLMTMQTDDVTQTSGGDDGNDDDTDDDEDDDEVDDSDEDDEAEDDDRDDGGSDDGGSDGISSEGHGQERVSHKRVGDGQHNGSSKIAKTDKSS